MKLTSDDAIPTMVPGQFISILLHNSTNIFLRRPFSINSYDKLSNEIGILVHIIGKGTQRLSEYSVGESLNVILPLGNGFTVPLTSSVEKLLLIGGGVGSAPLLFLSQQLKQLGFDPVILLGARSENDILQYEDFKTIGDTYITTENGSLGEKGYVTDHSLLNSNIFSKIYACGPKPMLQAVAKYARQHETDCEVSLENMMACGIGACLCCVEKTVQGNTCICTEGPVFNINQLTWQI